VALSRNSDESLFGNEKEVMRTAMANISDKRYYGNELLLPYKTLASQYQRLLRITKKVFYISDSQGQVLQKHQNEIQNLLDNANQGFLTFGRDLKVDRQYSAECTRIFGKKIGGLPITQVLGQGNSALEETLNGVLMRAFSCRTGLEQKELAQIPAIFKINEKDIQVECKIIAQAEEVADSILIMMILTDITERLKAEERIRFLSFHDKLTSLYNRAHVEAVLPELEKPESLPISIIMLDMNGLKLINDVFGHQQGDLFLIELAKILKQSCQQKDIVARWGGDEFLIVLPQADETDCSLVCEKIQQGCYEVTGVAIPLSAAMGAATKKVGSIRLDEMFNIAENRMYNDKLNKGKEVRRNMIASLEGILRDRCFENNGHSERVRQLVLGFVAFLGMDMNSPEIKPLTQLVKLHDIGKVAIPEAIWGKAGPLTSSEWEIVKGHSDIGYRMAQSIGEPTVADIILALHERWDGSGYPYGLKGEQIPLLARIFSLADVYDVITHDRPYKLALDNLAAMREIESGKGMQFDPELAKRFLDYLTRRTNGM
jgi:diguanylate cyclase (GGDEF)-like protein